MLSKSFLSLLKKEFISVWRDKKSRSVIFIPPILQLFVFSHAATLDITNIKIAVFDRDNTDISREFTRQISKSRYFSKIYFPKNEKELKKLVDREKVRAGVYISSEFTRKYKAKTAPEIFIVTDGRRTNSSQITSGYITEISDNFLPVGEYKVSKPKVNAVVENRFNPNLSYHWFIIASLAGILPMTAVILLSSLSLARDREEGTFDELLVLPVEPQSIVFSKIAVSIFFGMANGIIILVLSLIFFKIPYRGSVFLYFLSLFIFLFAISGVGIYISSISKTRQQAMLLVFAFMFPSIMLSGYTTPIENITPKFLQYLTLLNPLRFFLVISKGIILKNMNFYYVFLNLMPVICVSLLTVIGSVRAFIGKVK